MYDPEKQKKVQEELTKKFPGLAMPNKVVKNDDEIELDLDDLDDALKSAPKKPSSPPPMARKSRDRSRSPASSDDSRHRHRSHKGRRSPSVDGDRRRSRKHHRRHDSRSSSSSDSFKRRRRDSPHGRDRREDEESRQEKMQRVLKIGKIYPGVIQKLIDIGIFIRFRVGEAGTDHRGRFYEGFVHVS